MRSEERGGGRDRPPRSGRSPLRQRGSTPGRRAPRGRCRTRRGPRRGSVVAASRRAAVSAGSGPGTGGPARASPSARNRPPRRDMGRPRARPRGPSALDRHGRHEAQRRQRPIPDGLPRRQDGPARAARSLSRSGRTHPDSRPTRDHHPRRRGPVTSLRSQPSRRAADVVAWSRPGLPGRYGKSSSPRIPAALRREPAGRGEAPPRWRRPDERSRQLRG